MGCDENCSTKDKFCGWVFYRDEDGLLTRQVTCKACGKQAFVGDGLRRQEVLRRQEGGTDEH